MSISKLQAAQKALAEAIAEIGKSGKKAGHEYFKPLFEKYPDLESFSWTQYTPYFNDGDSCTFGTHDIDQVNGHEEYSDEWGANVLKGWGKDEVKGPLYEAYTEAKKYLSELGDTAAEALFGDHCRVIVSRKKVTVEEEDHE